MKYKYNNQWVDLSIKALDSMPVGTQVEYTGSTIPTGWEQVNDYSNDEIDTGKKWIDGKPIYRRVFTSITISANSGDIDILTLSDYSIDTIIDISKSYLLTASNEKWYAPSTYYGFVGNEYYFFSLWATSTAIRAKTSGSSIRGTIYLIVEYTKTTD